MLVGPVVFVEKETGDREFRNGGVKLPGPEKKAVAFFYLLWEVGLGEISVERSLRRAEKPVRSSAAGVKASGTISTLTNVCSRVWVTQTSLPNERPVNERGGEMENRCSSTEATPKGHEVLPRGLSADEIAIQNVVDPSFCFVFRAQILYRTSRSP